PTIRKAGADNRVRSTPRCHARVASTSKPQPSIAASGVGADRSAPNTVGRATYFPNCAEGSWSAFLIEFRRHDRLHGVLAEVGDQAGALGVGLQNVNRLM